MRPVLVTTEYRGVFFGYAEDTSGGNITLTGARNCIYWPSAKGGFMRLATEGPAKGARIGCKVEQINLRKVTSVTEVSETAVTAWENADVYRGSTPATAPATATATATATAPAPATNNINLDRKGRH